MTEKDKATSEAKHDLREGQPPTSTTTVQIHSVLDAGRRPTHEGNRLVTPEGDEGHVSEGQDVV